MVVVNGEQTGIVINIAYFAFGNNHILKLTGTHGYSSVYDSTKLKYIRQDCLHLLSCCIVDESGTLMINMVFAFLFH